MIKKRLVLLMIFVVCKIHGMDLIQKGEQFLGSPEAKGIEDKIITFVQSPDGQHIIQEVEGKVVSLFSHSTATTTTTTTTSTTTPTIPKIVVSDNPVASSVLTTALSQSSASIPSIQADDIQEQILLSKSNKAPRAKVPNLQLNSSLPPMRAVSTSLQPKTPVKTTNQLSKTAIQIVGQTARNNQTSSVSHTPSVSSNPIIINMSDQIGDTQQMYTEERVWKFMASWDPSIYAFAQKKGLSLEEAEAIGMLKRKINIEPEAVVDYVNKNKLSDDKTSVIPPEKYKSKVQGEKSETYKEIVLEMLLEFVNEESGKSSPSSVLENTHINLLEDQAASDQTTKRKLWIAVIVKAVLLGGISLGGIIWGAYGQAIKPTTAPTFAPTVAPTFAPI